MQFEVVLPFGESPTTVKIHDEIKREQIFEADLRPFVRAFLKSNPKDQADDDDDDVGDLCEDADGVFRRLWRRIVSN